MLGGGVDDVVGGVVGVSSRWSRRRSKRCSVRWSSR